MSHASLSLGRHEDPGQNVYDPKSCIMMWGSGLEDGNKHTRENLPFVIAGKGGGSIKTGRFFAHTKGNQGDPLTTHLTCASIPIDRPVGIATKQIEELEA